MGGNGSFLKKEADAEGNRKFRTVYSLSDDIKILQLKNPRQKISLPVESHTPGRIYAVFLPDGRDVSKIACYGEDGKKKYEIHTKDHHGLSPHCHYWEDGENGTRKQREGADKLTLEMVELLEKVRNMKRG